MQKQNHSTLHPQSERLSNPQTRQTASLPTKADKYRRILDAAYELFLERETTDLPISDITQRADVAKGTFYLYFEDKEALRNALITEKSEELFRAAIVALRAAEIIAFDEQILFVINYVINELAAQPMILRLITKNLSLGVFNQGVQNYVGLDDSDIMRALLAAAERSGVRLRSPRVLLFMIIELTSSTCFSCILEQKPLPIEEYKPYLFETIRQMIWLATER